MAFFRAVAVLGLVVGALAGAGFYLVERQDNPAAPSAAPPTTAAKLPATGPVTELVDQAFGRFKYWIRREGSSSVAVFTPMLPRDDVTVLGAAAAATKAAYGVTLHPTTAAPAGREILVIGDGGTTFYLFLIKEDSGEVHTIRIRQG